MRARLEEAWGAKVTEAMGIGDIAASLWGECEQQDGMHFSGRGFVHFELIDPESGAAAAARGRRRGRARLHASRARGGAAAPLPQPRPRRGVDRRVRLRAHVAARPLHRPHRRHADRARRQRLSRRRSARSSARFAPAVSGPISIRPRRQGFRQDPPLPVLVELGEGESRRRGARRSASADASARRCWSTTEIALRALSAACRAATTSRSWSTGRRRSEGRVKTLSPCGRGWPSASAEGRERGLRALETPAECTAMSLGDSQSAA